ncbi:DoxX family membrane protein [Seongchinamella sediminis]|uniref:DoxX family membrane protein n=1 Tax=Seongchinamella sediminis TaxID=2283635 RepID=A0A3L7DV02_9GAMM|nr:DoxX family protein [Seongchinamella sediminis]RLQ21398.1 DoxX family membrane protein [Seongchinamella sediminis]
MNALAELYYNLQNSLCPRLRHLDGLPPLALRLYLVPVFWVAGTQKLAGIDSTIDWFGNDEWGLGLPAPELLAYLAAYTEVIGALLLLLGLATRWIALPLIVTMLVAIFAVHWDQGWAAIADSGSREIAVRLGTAKDILREHSNYSWLTEKGSFVILNNGIEFAVTYLVMLLSLLFTGGGRYVSVDYYLSRLYPNPAR